MEMTRRELLQGLMSGGVMATAPRWLRWLARQGEVRAAPTVPEAVGVGMQVGTRVPSVMAERVFVPLVRDQGSGIGDRGLVIGGE